MLAHRIFYSPFDWSVACRWALVAGRALPSPLAHCWERQPRQGAGAGVDAAASAHQLVTVHLEVGQKLDLGQSCADSSRRMGD